MAVAVTVTVNVGMEIFESFTGSAGDFDFPQPDTADNRNKTDIRIVVIFKFISASFHSRWNDAKKQTMHLELRIVLIFLLVPSIRHIIYNNTRFFAIRKIPHFTDFYPGRRGHDGIKKLIQFL